VLDAPDDLAPWTDREQSWLDFNDRVAARAERPDVPLLERLGALAVAAANLDEFHMVRLPRLAEVPARRRAAARRARAQHRRIADTFERELRPALADHGLRIVRGDELEPELASELFEAHWPPLRSHIAATARGEAPPLHGLRNGAVYVALRWRPDAASEDRMTVVDLPAELPRFARVRRGDRSECFVALEDVVRRFAADALPEVTLLEAAPLRVTRAAELDIDDAETDDLLSAVEGELRRRDAGTAVRLEIGEDASWTLVGAVRRALTLDGEDDVAFCPSFVDLAGLESICEASSRSDLRERPFAPTSLRRPGYSPSIFRTIREGDVLLHHPYDASRPLIDLLEEAAEDPDVVAVKQTLYRTRPDSARARALARAAEAGKEVVAVVELTARFEEAANIARARTLAQSGAHVVYGPLGTETHAEMLLVTRREGDELRRYLHLGTGNLNSQRASIETNLSLLTADPALTSDAMLLFNLLTGYGELPPMQKLIVAPFGLRRHVLLGLEREIEHARAGRPAGLVAQLNTVADPEIISALYRARREGVPIDLLVRGVCCLRPSPPDATPRLRVRSTIDRFVEHVRILHWRNGGEDEVYSGSADWTPRSLDRRIEVLFPIEDPTARQRVVSEILPISLQDERFTWEQGPDGVYHPLGGPDGAWRAQTRFIALAEARARQSRSAEPSKRPGRWPGAATERSETRRR
jgi:polyphosphate kinase